MKARFRVEDVFELTGRDGLVVTGEPIEGSIRAGMRTQPLTFEYGMRSLTVTGLEIPLHAKRPSFAAFELAGVASRETLRQALPPDSVLILTDQPEDSESLSS